MDRFLGDRRTHIAHDLRGWHSCLLGAVDTDAIVYFGHIDHARTSGFEPCQVCTRMHEERAENQQATRWWS